MAAKLSPFEALEKENRELRRENEKLKKTTTRNAATTAEAKFAGCDEIKSLRRRARQIRRSGTFR